MYITAKIIMTKLNKIYVQYMNDKYELVYKILRSSNSCNIDYNNLKPGTFIVCEINNKNKTVINKIIDINELGI